MNWVKSIDFYITIQRVKPFLFRVAFRSFSIDLMANLSLRAITSVNRLNAAEIFKDRILLLSCSYPIQSSQYTQKRIQSSEIMTFKKSSELCEKSSMFNQHIAILKLIVRCEISEPTYSIFTMMVSTILLKNYGSVRVQKEKTMCCLKLMLSFAEFRFTCLPRSALVEKVLKGAGW